MKAKALCGVDMGDMGIDNWNVIICHKGYKELYTFDNKESALIVFDRLRKPGYRHKFLIKGMIGYWHCQHPKCQVSLTYSRRNKL